MAFGVVLRPDAAVSRSLIALSHAIGAGREPLMLLGDDAPPHVSVLHHECTDDQASAIAAAMNPYLGQSFEAKIIGLLYSVVAPGDYYVPTGGYYFGLEVVRRPALNELHQDFLRIGAEAGATPLGLVDDDYRPHITLGMTAEPPVLPSFATIPSGLLRMTMAGGRVGPFGTFPELGVSP